MPEGGRRVVTITLEGGIAFFEDGTEVSNISPAIIKAAPKLLAACLELKGYVEDVSKPNEAGWDGVELANEAFDIISKEMDLFIEED
jgi:hypothetical protein